MKFLKFDKNVFSFLLKYLTYWISFTFFARVLFLIYNSAETAKLDILTLINTFAHGFRLDLSISSYKAILPIIIYIFINRYSWINGIRILRFFSMILLLISAILVCGDLGLYPYWKYRIDPSALIFLKNPIEIIGSTTNSDIFFFFLFLILILFLFYKFYIFIESKIIFQKSSEKFSYLSYFLALSLAIIFSRGGIQKISINQSDAYFSKSVFANHAAINPEFNFIFYLLKKKKENPYKFLSPKEANLLLKKYFQKEISGNPMTKVLKVKKPNIILVVLESFTSKVIEPLGGKKNITPRINELVKEGILFDKFYANADRSPKGLVAVLSGYPAQPTDYIIAFASKTKKLPFISKVLNKEKYFTSFYYGGDISFSNYFSYIHNGEFQRIVALGDFSNLTQNSIGAWGAHDHIVFDKILSDLQETKSPFFSMVLSLTSHEPFDIPTEPKFSGNDVETKFLNSIHYTDSALGDFIDKAQKQSWWKNTLVIVLADHGHSMPGNTRQDRIEKFQIPMLWFGPALKNEFKNTRISKLASQTDIANTLLSQMDLETKDFQWSRNIFSKPYPEFVHYIFNNGFGFIYNNNFVIYDNVSKGITSCKSVEEKQKLYDDSFFTDENLEIILKKSKKEKAKFGDFLIGVLKKTSTFEQRKETILAIDSISSCEEMASKKELKLGKVYLQMTYEDFLNK